MRIALAILLLAALVSFGAPLAWGASSYTENPGLGESVDLALRWASQENGSAHLQPERVAQPVEVRCYTSGPAFDRSALALGLPDSVLPTLEAYWDGGSTIHIRPQTCMQAMRFAGGTITPLTASSYETILHESLHRQGFRNEHLTETYALGSMWAAGMMVRDRKLHEEGWTPTNAQLEQSGRLAFYYAVDWNHLDSQGPYRVATSEALHARVMTWAAIG
jgi:hypothetical protein